MISTDTVQKALSPFDVALSDEAVEKLIAYLDLLLKWNRKINLTSITTPEECITRHFGESFLAARLLPLRSSLLDIGSGAGFPGLALKLLVPQLQVVLLEPAAKKRAFLKEVARACGLGAVEVVGSRLDEFVRSEQGRRFDVITARAVGSLDSLVPAARGLLSAEGRLCLWVGTRQVRGIVAANSELQWLEPEAIPFSNERVILVGAKPGPGIG